MDCLGASYRASGGRVHDDTTEEALIKAQDEWAASTAGNTAEGLDTTIMTLKTERKKLADQKTLNSRLIRNSEKRRQRLKKKSTQLSNNDLIEVFNQRLASKKKRQEVSSGSKPTTKA